MPLLAAGLIEPRGIVIDAKSGVTGAGRTVAFTAVAMTGAVLCFTPTALRFVGEMAFLLALWMTTSAATALVTLPAALVVLRPRFLSAR